MSTFSTSKSYKATETFIPYAVERIRDAFSADGFEISQKAGFYNKTIIEVTKGNLVKKVVGLKQGLQITFETSEGHVNVEAKVTVLKDQAIASTLTLLVAWPVLIPQVIGLIKQSGLDDKAIGIIDTAHAHFENEQPTFCTHCGGSITGNPTTCPHCGALL